MIEQQYTFGELLRGFRERAGLKQEELAEKIAVRRQTISDWEMGNHKPRNRDQVKEIGDVLDLTEEEYQQLLDAAFFPRPRSSITEAEMRRPSVLPTLPWPYVHREEAYGALKVGVEHCDGGHVPFLVTGPPGAGKTALVAKFARQARESLQFPAGVYWIRLGETPQLVLLLRGLAAQFGVQLPPGRVSIDNAAAVLQEILADQAALVVLDDAWRAEDVRPFLVGGEQCRVMVTANPGVADDLVLPLGQELQLGGMTPREGLQLVEGMLGQDPAARRTFQEVGPRVFWSPYILKRLARLGNRQDWSDLEAQFKRTTVDAESATEMQWQQVLETFHEMWLRSLGDNVSLVQPWASVPWFSSFGLNAVQAIYRVDREVAAERLGILSLYGLIQQTQEDELGGSRYRWDTLMWSFIRRRFRSPTDDDFDWATRFDGGWGRTPLWCVSVPGRSMWKLQPWRLDRWRPDTRALGLSRMKRRVISMPEYAITYLKDKRLEWSAETWATWYRLQQRTTRFGSVFIPCLVLGGLALLANHFLPMGDWTRLAIFPTLSLVLVPM
ncbi:MAG: hypothetical protein DRI81_10025 [Chloroflexi bacterium]|nr:MAG: hypothetical protein DRI81_10025 [Chloroflexota bacterium]